MIYVTGDMHGLAQRFEDPRLHKLKKGDTLLICGDFGFIWNGSNEEMRTLKKLSNKKYNICFIDGTHENFDMLSKLKIKEWNGGKVHQIAQNIFHLMRGQVFTIEGKKIFTMGGGESPDLEIRYEMNTWNELEIPTSDELLEGVDNLQKSNASVDIIITHEPPASVKEFLMMQMPDSVTITTINTYLDDITKTCTYKHWYFGSLHLDKFISSTQTCVFENILNAATGRPV